MSAVCTRSTHILTVRLTAVLTTTYTLLLNNDLQAPPMPSRSEKCTQWRVEGESSAAEYEALGHCNLLSQGQKNGRNLQIVDHYKCRSSLVPWPESCRTSSAFSLEKRRNGNPPKIQFTKFVWNILNQPSSVTRTGLRRDVEMQAPTVGKEHLTRAHQNEPTKKKAYSCVHGKVQAFRHVPYLTQKISWLYSRLY